MRPLAVAVVLALVALTGCHKAAKPEAAAANAAVGNIAHAAPVDAPAVAAAPEATSDVTKSGQPKMKNENPWGSSQAL